jgi:hypothetical protein
MRKSRTASIDAMLRHLAAHRDPQDFPSTAYERQALIEAAGKRRLIEWQKERRRYELTSSGLRRLRRGRGLGLSTLAISAGIGAAVAATALLMVWRPGDRAAGEPAALGARVENIGVPDVTADAAPAAVPVTTANAQAPAEPVKTAEPAKAAEPATSPEPAAEPGTRGAKWRAGRKSRQRAARSPGRRHWNFGQRYRDERYAGTGRQ